MQEMMDLQVANQRREELLREAELRHQAKVLRATRRQRARRRSALLWELKRYAGRLLKFLRSLNGVS